MKKALIVANLAGFASFLMNDIKTLKNHGYDVDFAANANKLAWSDTEKRLDELGVHFYQIDFDSKKPLSRTNFTAYKQIKMLLKKGQYDLLHCHTPIAGIISRLAANKYRRKGLKVLYTTHGFAFTSLSSKKTWLMYYTLEKIGSRFSDAVITINQEDFENAKKMHCKNVFYINGVGVNIQKYSTVNVDREAYRASIGVAPEDIMVLCVGELSNRKNHQIIIKAIGDIADKDRYVLVICGAGIDGGTGSELKQLAQERNVRLNLLGFRHDIPEITFCSDIGAIPSTREGLGLSGIQSLAAGIPLVGSRVQGIKDYIINGETGYLCNPNNHEEFKDAIVKLSCLDSEQRKQMSNQCREMAKRFDVSVSRSQIIQIYTKMGVL